MRNWAGDVKCSHVLSPTVGAGPMREMSGGLEPHLMLLRHWPAPVLLPRERKRQIFETSDSSQSLCCISCSPLSSAPSAPGVGAGGDGDNHDDPVSR